jgi:hypothetical protein
MSGGELRVLNLISISCALMFGRTSTDQGNGSHILTIVPCQSLGCFKPQLVYRGFFHQSDTSEGVRSHVHASGVQNQSPSHLPVYHLKIQGVYDRLRRQLRHEFIFGL